MARLFRLSNLNDRFNTQIFTFQLPASIIKDGTPDATSRDFTYGHHIWNVSVIRAERHIGAFLTLRNTSAELVCNLDFTFTLVNDDHFSKSEVVVKRSCDFSLGHEKHGCKTFVGVGDLTSRGFRHYNGEFLLELEMRNIRTTFEQYISLSRDKDMPHCRYQKLETSYFSFGGFDWSFVLYPYGDSPEKDGHSQVYLMRQTNFDHLCKVQFRLYLGHGERSLDSDILDQMLDISGQGKPYEPGYALSNLASSKGRLRFKVELFSVSAVSEVQLSPLNRSRNRASVFDREKQAWAVESDVSRSNLKLRLFYMDIRNVPRKCLRHVTFGVTILPARGHHARPIKATGSPFMEYYSQTDPDDCFDIPTDIGVDNLNPSGGGYLDTDQKLTIQVEWMACHILHHERFQRLDDGANKHKHQMLREIMALQAENFALEKQLHSYQISIAKTNAKVKGEDSPVHTRDGYRRHKGQGQNCRR